MQKFGSNITKLANTQSNLNYFSRILKTGELEALYLFCISQNVKCGVFLKDKDKKIYNVINSIESDHVYVISDNKLVFKFAIWILAIFNFSVVLSFMEVGSRLQRFINFSNKKNVYWIRDSLISSSYNSRLSKNLFNLSSGKIINGKAVLDCGDKLSNFKNHIYLPSNSYNSYIKSIKLLDNIERKKILLFSKFVKDIDYKKDIFCAIREKLEQLNEKPILFLHPNEYLDFSQTDFIDKDFFQISNDYYIKYLNQCRFGIGISTSICMVFNKFNLPFFDIYLPEQIRNSELPSGRWSEVSTKTFTTINDFESFNFKNY